MTSTRTIALLAAGLAVMVSALANAYAVGHHLPYALGGHGSPDAVAADWPSHGTALGPPLLPFLLLLLGALVMLAPGRWGRIGDALLVLTGGLLLFGTLGEPTTWQSAQPAQVAIRVLMVVVAVGLLVAGVSDWRSRRPLHEAGLTRPLS